MRRRYSVKPSKPASLLGGIVGIFFIFIGITTVIPYGAGVFGIVWTLSAVGITVYHFYNFFSKKGAGVYRIDIEDEDGAVPKNNTTDNQKVDFDVKLRKLQKLFDDGIITKEEYEKKKKELLESNW